MSWFPVGCRGYRLVAMVAGRTEHFENSFADTTSKPGAFALAFYSGLFSYAGW